MAPTSMVATARHRRASTAWLRARRSAAMPVSVIVRTVVVRSGTANRRAAAFCRPMATAVRAAIESLTGAAKGCGCDFRNCYGR